MPSGLRQEAGTCTARCPCSPQQPSHTPPARRRHARVPRTHPRFLNQPFAPLPPQALKALPNATGPDLARHLRQVGLAFSVSNDDSSRWLDTDLLPAVLSALRSLPGGRSPADAVEACAAATSVLANLAVDLRLPRHREALLAALAADAEACRALAHWGVACPQADDQLPPGCEAHMGHDVLSVPAGVTSSARHPFWTPMTHCATFVTSLVIMTDMEGPNSGTFRSHFKEAATPGVMERLLTLAARFPCRTPP
jgi:hypothetical protein